MESVLNSYETVIVLSAHLSDEEIENLTQKVKGIIEKNAQFENMDSWGKRKLAYTIQKKHTEGHYFLCNFKSNSEFPSELERIYKITDGILRTLIVKKEVA